MEERLLATKLCIPPDRPQRVRRPRLLARLDADLWQEAGFARKLTLVSAPAGYGKTTLVADWSRQIAARREFPCADHPLRVCWLSLDEVDNDPVRFLTYFIAALQQGDAHIGVEAQALLGAPQPPPAEIVLTALINEIGERAAPLLLTLDDYQVIHTLPIHEQIGFLLAHQPPQLHLVLLTREDPFLPIARLRARGQVLEIRQDDLRFSGEEAAEFLQRCMRLDLGPDDVAALARRTEGWIAGLQLAALSLSKQDDPQAFVRAFTGNDRYVLDYLSEEVIAQQSPEMQAFLLRTSILDRLSAPLCDAVVGRTDSQGLLATLEQANLFLVPLDPSRQWYRYHRLFGELLRHQLRLHADISAALLHERASHWFEENGLASEAVHHALAAADWTRAAALIDSVQAEMLKRGEVATLIGWYGRFPEAVLLATPRLCYDSCWPLLVAGRFDAAGPRLEQVEQAAQGDPPFLGEIAAAQAFLARGVGDHPRMVRQSQRALTLLPQSDVNARCLVALNLGLAYWHGGQMQEAEGALAEALRTARASDNHYAALTASIFQGRITAVRGQLRRAAGMLARAIQEGGPIPINALAHLDLSALHYEWNDLDRADHHLQQAIDLSRRGRNDEFLVACWLMMARLRLAQGDGPGVRRALDAAWERVHAGGIPEPTTARLVALQVQVDLAQDDLASALGGAEHLREDVDAHAFYRFLGLARAQLLLAQGRRAGAAATLEQLHARATQGGWQYGAIAVGMLQSLAAPTLDAGVEFLAEALALAEPEGFLRTFADAGALLVPLLKEAARQGVSPAYVGRILALIGETAPPTGPEVAGLVEPLSEREIEVLRLVAAGLSNREIAETLVISLGTVKTHVHHLCGKLEVRNRTQASARARDLGLV